MLIFCAISLCSCARGKEPYPIVDRSVQTARDNDRRAILEAELASEQSDLRNAQETVAKAPSDEARKEAHRHEENVKALRRELDRLTTSIRVTARTASDVAIKQPASNAHEVPFWDAYRRTAPPTDFQPPEKESP
jgi:thioredoxin-like negative regulator of GroEL